MVIELSPKKNVVVRREKLFGTRMAEEVST